MTARVQLVHWNAEEAKPRVELLRRAGYRVSYDRAVESRTLTQWSNALPDVIVIDLSRLPSHGREVGVALRQRRSTRRVPLVFVEGGADKVAGIREILPDAMFTSWSRIRGALKLALVRPPAEPVVPQGMMQRYSETPLTRKLGIKPGSRVAVLEAPRSFEAALGELPAGVVLADGLDAQFDVAIWFVRSIDVLRSGLSTIASQLGGAMLWIAWPKKASGERTDLTQQTIRETGFDLGLVDYKICSVDAIWSALAFVRRKERRR